MLCYKEILKNYPQNKGKALKTHQEIIQDLVREREIEINKIIKIQYA